MTAPGGKLVRVRLPVVTPRLALCLAELSGLPFFLRSTNDPSVLRNYISRRAPLKRSEEVAYVTSSRRATAKGEKLNLSITFRETGELVGGIRLEVRDWTHRHGRTGYSLTAPYWHRGYGSEAASAVLRVAFQTLKLHRVDARVFSFNPRSARSTFGFPE
ncbi:MAG: GNAT family N-acetyltransferase [Thermoplasmata archaeon]